MFLNENWTRQINHKSGQELYGIESLLLEELGQANQVGEEEKIWNELDGEKIGGLEISLKTGRCKIRYGGKNQKVIQRITILT